MTLTVANWDIKKSALWGVHTKPPSILGAFFRRIPDLGYVVGDILSLDFKPDENSEHEKYQLHLQKNEAWDSLLSNNEYYCDIAECAIDQEDQSNDDQVSGTILSALKWYFNRAVKQPQYMNFRSFEMFLAFSQLKEPIPEKRLVNKNFWIGEEELQSDIDKWFEIVDSFNKNGGAEFFDTFTKNESSVDLHCSFDVKGFADLALVSAYLTLKAGKTLSPCAHCGRLFTPSRSSEIYCSRIVPVPNIGHKTCKEAAKYEKQLKRERASESGKIYKSINTMLAAKVSYAKDEVEENTARKKLFDFREKAKMWRSDVKQGQKTEDEYIAFLNSYKKRKKQ